MSSDVHRAFTRVLTLKGSRRQNLHKRDDPTRGDTSAPSRVRSRKTQRRAAPRGTCQSTAVLGLAGLLPPQPGHLQPLWVYRSVPRSRFHGDHRGSNRIPQQDRTHKQSRSPSPILACRKPEAKGGRAFRASPGEPGLQYENGIQTSVQVYSTLLKTTTTEQELSVQMRENEERAR